jgi:hypothetical protein
MQHDNASQNEYSGERSATGPLGNGLSTDRRQFLRGVAGSTALGASGLLAGCSGGSGSSGGRTITVGYQPFGTPYWSELVVKHGELIGKYVEDIFSDQFSRFVVQGAEIISFADKDGPLFVDHKDDRIGIFDQPTKLILSDL